MSATGWAEVLVCREDAEALRRAADLCEIEAQPVNAAALRAIAARYDAVAGVTGAARPAQPLPVSEGGPIRICEARE